MSSEKQQLSALNSLVGGIRVAQSRGCYTLEEAADLCAAVQIFTEGQNVQANTQALVEETIPVRQRKTISQKKVSK